MFRWRGLLYLPGMLGCYLERARAPRTRRTPKHAKHDTIKFVGFHNQERSTWVGAILKDKTLNFVPCSLDVFVVVYFS